MTLSTVAGISGAGRALIGETFTLGSVASLTADDVVVAPGARVTVDQLAALKTAMLDLLLNVEPRQLTIAGTYAELRNYLNTIQNDKTVTLPESIGGLVLTDTVGALTTPESKSLFVALRNEALTMGLDFGGAIRDTAEAITDYFGSSGNAQDALGRLFLDGAQWASLGEAGVSEIRVTDGEITLSGQPGTSGSVLNNLINTATTWADGVETIWLKFAPDTEVTAVMSFADVTD